MPGSSWERVASLTGGTVAGLAAAVGGDGETVVFAATSVGVFGSSDAGRIWSLLGPGSSPPFADAVAPSAGFGRDKTVFVCAADGLYRSTDGGDTWQRVLVGSRMLSAAISTGFGQPGVAGTETGGQPGVVVAGTEADGVLRSEDAGRTWTGANAGLLDLTALSLALSPEFQRDRTGFVGTATGLYRTRNGARSWRAVDTGFDEPAVQCLAISPAFAEDALVLAGTEAHGLLRSTDGGATWHTPELLAASGVTAIAFCPGYPRRRVIAVATEAGIALSRDGGQNWRTIPSPLGANVLSLVFVRHGEAEVLLAGLHRAGVARSENDGETWEPANAGLSARLAMGLACVGDGTLFTASLEDGVCTSTDGGRTWVDCNDGLTDPAVLSLAVSPSFARDRTLYAATAGGIFVSRDAAATWRLAIAATAPPRALASVSGSKGEGASTVVTALYGGTLLVSDDAGRSWRTLTPAFGGGEVISLALSPAYARDRTLFVATSKSAGGEDGAAEVALWRSVDDGKRWERWLVERDVGSHLLPSGPGSLLPLAVPPAYPMDEVVFAGLGGRVMKPLRHAREMRKGERRPIWRGLDVGDGRAPVTAVAVSPAYLEDHTVFAATNAGVWRSRNAGDSYQPWSEGFGAAPPRIVALAVSPAYQTDRSVYALGLGGIVWHRTED